MSEELHGLSKRDFLGGLALTGVLATLASAQDEGAERAFAVLAFPKVLVFVRHAEKAHEPQDNPPLSEEGVARAERLARMFAKSGVTHVYTSEYLRTQQTLAPLAFLTGLDVRVAKASDIQAAHSAIEMLPRGSFTVFAGHSNTVPALLEAVTDGQVKVVIDEHEYDRVFVVVQWGPKKASVCFELRS